MVHTNCNCYWWTLSLFECCSWISRKMSIVNSQVGIEQTTLMGLWWSDAGNEWMMKRRGDYLLLGRLLLSSRLNVFLIRGSSNAYSSLSLSLSAPERRRRSEHDSAAAAGKAPPLLIFYSLSARSSFPLLFPFGPASIAAEDEGWKEGEEPS